MAQKRMFDRAIIRTDRFMDLSPSAKALYFLLGLEADDEGFVSPRLIMRMYGGVPDDIKNLVESGYVIPFKTGVVVITDWLENNYLDTTRIKPTLYLEEKKQLLTFGRKYVLNTCLTRIGEDRIEETHARKLASPIKIRKAKMQKYNERDFSDSYEPAIDISTGSFIEGNVKGESSTSMKDLVAWAVSRRGGPFSSIAKQYAALKRIKNMKYTPDDVENRWVDLENDKFYKEKGFDFADVASSLSKKPPR